MQQVETPSLRSQIKQTVILGKVGPMQSEEEIIVRDALIQKYLPYATSVANKIIQTLSSDADGEEVVCNARLGLLEAAKRYDPALKVDFKTFAYYRIKGAIYDGLRKAGWIPRALYARMKLQEEEREGEETRSKVGLGENLKELASSVAPVASVYIVSLDAGEEPLDLEDKKANDIEERAEFQKVKEIMMQAIEELPPKERKLIKMYYFQEKTLEEAGEKLSLSKSWTCRLHARALDLLFKRISSFQVGDEAYLEE